MLTPAMIVIQPAPELRRAFAQWAVAQTPKPRTVSSTSFAIAGDLFAQAPEEILIGALVDGHRYVSPDEDAALGGRLLPCGWCREGDGREIHPHPECPYPGIPDTTERNAPTVALIGDQGPEAVIPLKPGPPTPAADPPAPGSDPSAPAADVPDGIWPCGICDRELTTARGRDAHRRQKHPEA